LPKVIEILSSIEPLNPEGKKLIEEIYIADLEASLYP
jgi:hypothetical protein